MSIATVAAEDDEVLDTREVSDGSCARSLSGDGDEGRLTVNIVAASGLGI